MARKTVAAQATGRIALWVAACTMVVMARIASDGFASAEHPTTDLPKDCGGDWSHCKTVPKSSINITSTCIAPSTMHKWTRQSTIVISAILRMPTPLYPFVPIPSCCANVLLLFPLGLHSVLPSNIGTVCRCIKHRRNRRHAAGREFDLAHGLLCRGGQTRHHGPARVHSIAVGAPQRRQ